MWEEELDDIKTVGSGRKTKGTGKGRKKWYMCVCVCICVCLYSIYEYGYDGHQLKQIIRVGVKDMSKLLFSKCNSQWCIIS